MSRRGAAVAAVMLLVASLAATARGEAGADAPLPELVDRPSPRFKGTTLAGGLLSLADLRGRVVLLNFWGIWCRPCRTEIPELARLHRELAPHGLEIVGINVGDGRKDLEAFVEEHAIPYPIVLDKGIAVRYDVEVFPTSVIIDRGGRMRHVEEGFTEGSTASVRRIIEHLLEKEP